MESATPTSREAVEQAGPPPSEAHGQRLLSGLRVRGDVAQIVGLEQRRGQQAHGHPRPEDEPPVVPIGEQVPGRSHDERSVLHVRRTRRGHETEEDEDEQLTEAEVSVRSGTPRVGPSRNAAHETERDEATT